jgi:four helix bundle protein
VGRKGPLVLASDPMMPYERFRAWQACDALVLAVYQVTAKFPKSELYGLTSQSRRAAVSGATNIAEGAAKRGPREFRRYLDIAIGSLSEVSYLLRLACKLGFLREDEWQQIDDLRADASRLTWRLYEAVARRRPAPTA